MNIGKDQSLPTKILGAKTAAERAKKVSKSINTKDKDADKGKKNVASRKGQDLDDDISVSSRGSNDLTGGNKNPKSPSSKKSSSKSNEVKDTKGNL